ncbi:hypothetical protein [Falsarthrobacter nasiphocae]|uniref:WxL domain surface cell wall-binding n=1 Tax=Falsarthrobacter nasiphocae TaxID=189863 RepID=A0AAE4C8B8_9MICC|nr:hypothetical protein [Falsarthrobacter nasiphocae]MDR6892240.1 hypothetical protein [Falsarthrobacter nasiphocae]
MPQTPRISQRFSARAALASSLLAASLGLAGTGAAAQTAAPADNPPAAAAPHASAAAAGATAAAENPGGVVVTYPLELNPVVTTSPDGSYFGLEGGAPAVTAPLSYVATPINAPGATGPVSSRGAKAEPLADGAWKVSVAGVDASGRELQGESFVTVRNGRVTQTIQIRENLALPIAWDTSNGATSLTVTPADLTGASGYGWTLVNQTTGRIQASSPVHPAGTASQETATLTGLPDGRYAFHAESAINGYPGFLPDRRATVTFTVRGGVIYAR